MLTFSLIVGCDKSGSSGMFHLDASKSFVVVLGKGSAMRGLETINIDENGSVQIHRLKDSRTNTWEHATMSLSPDLKHSLTNAIADNKLVALNEKYQDRNIKDGSQWILSIRQGITRKTVYFDNQFPSQIVRFAEELDRIIETAGINKAHWEQVDTIQSRNHETELWNAIKH